MGSLPKLPYIRDGCIVEFAYRSQLVGRFVALQKETRRGGLCTRRRWQVRCCAYSIAQPIQNIKALSLRSGISQT